MERLRAELGRYPRTEDLFFVNFKVVLDPTEPKNLELGVKIDPKVHDIYADNNKSKALVAYSLDLKTSFADFKQSLENSFHAPRLLIHSRRLLALYLLTETNQKEFFNLESSSNFTKSFEQNDQDETERQNNSKIESFLHSEFFHANPMNYANKTFENESDVFIKDVVNLKMENIIESFSKSIRKLIALKKSTKYSQRF